MNLMNVIEGFALSNRGLQSLTSSAVVRSSKLGHCSHVPLRQHGSLQFPGIFSNHQRVEFSESSARNASESISNLLPSRASTASSPETSLREGTWVKLICGASFEDVVEIRNLSLVYTLAGVDCIDCAADPAVLAAVVEGVNTAKEILEDVESSKRPLFIRPWIMISINDDEDPHFRKAEFNSEHCPLDCPRPCETVCPALAINFREPKNVHGATATPLDGGIISERCYGCGRCLPVCPMGLISATTYVRPIEAVLNLILSPEVDAIEIHTGAGRLGAFQRLVEQLGSTLSSLKLVAVSVPDLGEATIPALDTMFTLMEPFLKHLNLWQLDGRPMSGDIGAGATRAAVALAARVAAATDRPPGYLQLAGGTNAYTVTAMKKKGLCAPSALQIKDSADEINGSALSPDHGKRTALIAGVAYGGYARKVVSKFLQKMHSEPDGPDCYPFERHTFLLEHYPSLMRGALQEATKLVDSLKTTNGS